MAREKHLSIAGLLERMVAEWLHRNPDEDEEQRQRDLHAAAAPSIGSLAGDKPGRSRRVRELLRKKLEGQRRTRST